MEDSKEISKGILIISIISTLLLAVIPLAMFVVGYITFIIEQHYNTLESDYFYTIGIFVFITILTILLYFDVLAYNIYKKCKYFETNCFIL